MMTIVCGAKSVARYSDLIVAVDAAPFVPTIILSSTTRWGDELGERYAFERKLPVHRVSLDTLKYGDRAYSMRNLEMVKLADVIIVLFNKKSKPMCEIMALGRTQGVKIHMYDIDQ